MRALPPLVCLLCGLVLLGCRPSRPPAVSEDEAANLRKIHTAYNQVAAKLGRPPKGLDELKPALAEAGDPEQLLRSPRDGQPYVIVWGVSNKSAAMPPPVLAYEQRGANGKRYVLTIMGVAPPMSEAEFAKLKLPK